MPRLTPEQLKGLPPVRQEARPVPDYSFAPFWGGDGMLHRVWQPQKGSPPYAAICGEWGHPLFELPKNPDDDWVVPCPTCLPHRRREPWHRFRYQ